MCSSKNVFGTPEDTGNTLMTNFLKYHHLFDKGAGIISNYSICMSSKVRTGLKRLTCITTSPMIYKA